MARPISGQDERVRRRRRRRRGGRDRYRRDLIGDLMVETARAADSRSGPRQANTSPLTGAMSWPA